MGLTHLRVTVRNPADAERCWEGEFLVDTGAIDPLVPKRRLESIGLRPQGRRTYSLADGRQLEMDVAVAQLELLGDLVGSTVVFGPDDAEPLLGVTALESLGVEVDPANQRLNKAPSVPLKLADRNRIAASPARAPASRGGGGCWTLPAAGATGEPPPGGPRVAPPAAGALPGAPGGGAP